MLQCVSIYLRPLPHYFFHAWCHTFFVTTHPTDCLNLLLCCCSSILFEHYIVSIIHECRWAKCDKCGELLKDLLPGKVTTVFERKDALNSNLNPGISLVGVRIPDHHFVREVVSRCGQPIALTSANVSDSRSTLDVEVSITLLIVSFGTNKSWLIFYFEVQLFIVWI